MKSRLGLLLILCLVLGAGSAGGFWLGTTSLHRSQREALPPDNSSQHQSSEVTVTTAPVTVRTVQRTVDVLGTLHGYEEVSISAKVEGRVRKIHHDMADRVPPGEVLLEIDPTDFTLAVRQAEKARQVELAKLGLEEAPARGFDPTKVPSVAQAAVRLENVRERLDRSQKAGRAAAAEELADRTADYRMALAEYDNQVLLARSGLAMVALKQEALAIARQQLDDAVIRVPTPTQPVPGAESGVVYAIAHRLVAEGTLVRPGTEVFKLMIDRTLKLRAAVPERFGAEIQPDQPVDVLTAGHTAPVVGRVVRVNPAVDSTTRTFEVEIQIANPSSRLKPGSFAKASIRTRLDPQAITVPLEALVNFAGITKIFLAEAGKAREVVVTLGVQSTDWVEIRTPALTAGAQVVISGQTALAANTPVVVRQEGP